MVWATNAALVTLLTDPRLLYQDYQGPTKVVRVTIIHYLK